MYTKTKKELAEKMLNGLVEEDGVIVLNDIPVDEVRALLMSIAAVDLPDELSWPYNLLSEVFGYEAYEDRIGSFTPDQEQGLMYAIGELSDRERRVLMLYFREGLGLAEVGEKFGVTQERIRQIKAKALRKLRNPRRSVYFMKGYLGTQLERITDLVNREDSAIYYLSEKIKEGIAEVDTITEMMDGNPSPASTDEIAIEDLELSVRSFNCLRRKGIDVIGDIKKMTYTDVINIRNLGLRSYEEIASAIKARTGEDITAILKANEEKEQSA